MPNKQDNAPFQWPQGTDEAWFTRREDVFPNGTRLALYSPRVLQSQIKECLDKVVSNQIKADKK